LSVQTAIAQEVLGAVKPLIDAKIAGLTPQLPTLDTEALTYAENELPKLDVPADIISFLKGENPTIVAAATPAEIAGLDTLKARIDALL